MLEQTGLLSAEELTRVLGRIPHGPDQVIAGHIAALEAKHESTLAAIRADLTAPLSVKCGTCGGDGGPTEEWAICPDCLGTGRTEHPAVAALRKAVEDAPHGDNCDSIHGFIHEEPCPFWTAHYCLVDYCCIHGVAMGESCLQCEARNGKGSMGLTFPKDAPRCRPKPCSCWKSTFPLAPVLSLLSAAEAQIKELESGSDQLFKEIEDHAFLVAKVKRVIRHVADGKYIHVESQFDALMDDVRDLASVHISDSTHLSDTLQRKIDAAEAQLRENAKAYLECDAARQLLAQERDEAEARERKLTADLTKELKWWGEIATEADMYGGEPGRSRALALRDMATEFWRIVHQAQPALAPEEPK